MNNFEMFCEEVVEALKEHFPENFQIDCEKVQKNNGIVLTSVQIRKPECNITPTIYLDEFYKSYCDGREIHAIVKEILAIYEKGAVNSFDISFFKDFSKVKEMLVFKLISKERNKELLKEVPHVLFLDMAIVFECLVKDEKIGNGRILIRNNHLEGWKVSLDEVYEIARANTPKLLPLYISGMLEVLKDSEEMMDDVFLQEALDSKPMDIISNEQRCNGAGTILYENALAQFAEKMDADLVILPSSIHECILLPYEKHMESDVLRAMVEEVNTTQVADVEVLSDNVYIYSRKENRVEIFE